MATKKKRAAKKMKVAKRPKQADLLARIRLLEKRLSELESNPVHGLGELIAIERQGRCSTVKLTGNLQIVNGAGRTDTANGCGNLIIGYNEGAPAGSGLPTARTGSHNFVLGRSHSYASYGGLLSGESNALTAGAPASCVIGGSESLVANRSAVVVGGLENKANSDYCVIIGGFDNGAIGGNRSVVMGGVNNRASAQYSSIFGGEANTTNGLGSTILGGSGLSTSLPGERIPP